MAGAMCCCLLAPAVALAAASGAHAGSHAAAASVRWGCLIGLGVVGGLLLIGQLAGARVIGIFLGHDKRVSTSKTIAAVWTLLLASVLFGFVWANLFNHPQALRHTGNIVGQYAVLFGGPLGSAILAKQIVTSQVAKDPSVKPAGKASSKDLIANDVGDTDLGDLQYVLFNTVALFFVISTLMHSPLNGLPRIPDVLLGLTSVAAVGYVGKKALTPTATLTAELDPNTVSGHVGDEVRIEIEGLAATVQALNALVQFGKSTPGQVAASSTVGDGRATLIHLAPDVGVDPNTPVDVGVVTEGGAVLAAGKYTYS
jgi:hypothetical protein